MTQLRYSLLLVAVIGGVFAGIALGSRSSWVEQQLVNWEVGRFQNDVEHAMNRGSFVDFEDRVILQDIPNTDFARGGVYFFGSSPMKWALKTWEFTEQERGLIHNVAIGATSHSLQGELIHYLADYRGLFAAGPKTRIVLGAYWSVGLKWSAAPFFGPLWERYGLYTYTSETGIRPVPANAAVRFVRTEKARCTSFLKGMANRAARLVTVSMGMKLEETEKIRDPIAIRKMSRAQRDDWETPLNQQMQALDELVAYIRDHGAEVTIVLLPTRQPVRECAFPMAYHQRVQELASRREVAFVDLSTLLEETEFWDINHSNYAGIQKTHAALLEMAHAHLKNVGLLP
jgi:hypothetical protein